jgi:hypothetical protein
MINGLSNGDILILKTQMKYRKSIVEWND